MRVGSILAATALLTLCSVVALAVESVRVDATSGAPRLMVDGRPVRARIFWGAPGSRPLPVGPAGKPVTFEFTALQDEPTRATMHFRFGNTPGDVYLDDIRVVDLDGGQDVLRTCDFEAGPDSFGRDWVVWPPDKQNTVGTVQVGPGKGRNGSTGLHVALRSPPTGPWPDFHFYHHATLSLRKGHRYRVTFWAQAQPQRDLTIAFYRPGATYTFLGGPDDVFAQQIKLAATAGVDLVSFPVALPWPAPTEQVDWSTVDAQCQAVLDANPQALLLPRIDMDPPAWWYEAHPQDAMVWDSGAKPAKRVVVASPAYRRDASERLAALVTHLEQTLGDHVAGYHPAGQNTGEWFYPDTWESPLNGYATADQAAWRRWLKDRYHSDQALRTAWRQPSISLATAVVPPSAARRASPAGALRDPATERSLIDFALYQQEMMADCVCQLAQAVRQASHGRKLVVFFYGYLFEFGMVGNAPATSGHYALRRVLDCPDIDVLCSPISYFDRGLGQSAPAMTAAESVALAGKMWLCEDDTRTYLGTGTFPGWQDGADTLEKTNQLLVRNTAQCALRNFGTWWMDLGATGWFNDPRMWAQMARLKALDQPLLENPLPYRPEVAAVIDEPSMIRVTPAGRTVTMPGVYEVRRPLGRMGAPYGQYLLDDVTAGRVHAKVYVMLTAWCLSLEQRRQLQDATRQSLCIWCYAPGYQEPAGTSLEAMGQLTGFQIKQMPKVKAWAQPTAAGRKLGLEQGFGVARPVEPLFTAVDAASEEILATYPDGSPAVALRRVGAGWSLFVGPPALSSQLLRLAARQAGVHLFTQTDCNVYANGPYLVLHASNDGPLEIDTGGEGPIGDVLSGEIVGQAPRLNWQPKAGETKVLRVGR